jgi:hypothetical protein
MKLEHVKKKKEVLVKLTTVYVLWFSAPNGD